VRQRLLEGLAVLVLLAALGGQLVYGLRADGMTNDEILFVSAGYRQLALGDYRLSPTHPPLANSLAGLGLLGMGLRVPPLDPRAGPLAWCYRFVHVENAAGAVLERARVPVVTLTLALALLVWLWARVVSGPAAGLVALALTGFHPSVVAHGHLATTDVAGAFFTLLAAFLFWRWLEAPRPGRAAAFAVALGLGAATRLTTLLALPVFALVALAAAFPRPRRQEEGLASPAGGVPPRATLHLAAALAILVPATLWASYGLHDAPWPEELARRPRIHGLAARALDAVAATHLVPAGFVDSVRFQVEHTHAGHPSYLLGELGKTGWPHYFLVAFAVKNTPGFLVALLLAPFFLLFVRRRSRGLPRDGLVAASASSMLARSLWAGVALVVFLASSTSRVQIGERYLLPLYPFVILLLAGLATPLLAVRRGWIVLCALLALHAGPTLMAAPGGTVSYFNLLAGGRDGGHRVLLDSNLDWGQDLPRLAAWMRAEGVGSVQLAYQGSDDPDRFAIAHEDLPGAQLYTPRPPARPFDGVVAVSPNLLHGLLPRLGDPYASLRERPPDARAGVFFIYRSSRTGPPSTGAARDQSRPAAP
jgi:hypothetical protein